MMPDIKHCSVEECYYNKYNKCHAEAITIGSISPKCDTYCKGAQHGGPSEHGHVGACHVNDCKWNTDMSCTAEGVDISPHGAEPDCDTFTSR